MKKGRLINWQKTRVVKTNVYSSPYWDFMERNGRRDDDGFILEYPTANPDVLAEAPENNTEWRDLLKEVFRDVKLSQRERMVLREFSFSDATEEKVAERIGITRRAVRIYLHRAKKKCEKLLVAKIAEKGV